MQNTGVELPTKLNLYKAVTGVKKKELLQQVESWEVGVEGWTTCVAP